jgi:hypothetical protein
MKTMTTAAALARLSASKVRKKLKGSTAQIPAVTQNLLDSARDERKEAEDDCSSPPPNMSSSASTMQSATVIIYPVATPKHLRATAKSIKIVNFGTARWAIE